MNEWLEGIGEGKKKVEVEVKVEWAEFQVPGCKFEVGGAEEEMKNQLRQAGCFLSPTLYVQPFEPDDHGGVCVQIAWCIGCMVWFNPV